MRFLMLSVLFVLGVSTQDLAAKAKVTRQIPIDGKFISDDLGGGEFAKGVSLRLTVVRAGGVYEFCGAVAYTNAQTRAAYRNFFRDSDITSKGVKVIDGLDFLYRAKTIQSMDGGPANCASTGVPVTDKNPDFDFKWSTRTYRVN